MTTSISRAGLIKFLTACGHEPRIETASEPGPLSSPADGGGDGGGSEVAIAIASSLTI